MVEDEQAVAAEDSRGKQTVKKEDVFMDKSLSSISEILGIDAEGQFKARLSYLNGILNSSSEWTRKLIEYAKKNFTVEQRNCLETLFYNGNNHDFFDIFNPTAYFAKRIYAIKELEFYLTDDVDISLVMAEYDTSFKFSSGERSWHERRFALMTNTWYDDSYSRFDFWKKNTGVPAGVNVDLATFKTFRKCLQEDGFFKLLDVILDKNNLKRVDNKDGRFMRVDEDALAKFVQ